MVLDMEDSLKFVGEDGKVSEKLLSVSPQEKRFNEIWLQELLINNPELLLASEVDKGWGKLIPLGREVSVTAGMIDNLYVTPEGLVCLVETKLYRNPEAHRTVIAQIIDYAKDLAQMTYIEFKTAVERSQLCGERLPIFERIAKHVKGVSEIEFENNVQESLRSGRFLLLIAGDKIYPEIAMLVETIQSAPNLEFKIGLVEMQVYSRGKEKPWPVLVIPQVVGKTHEVVRSVVRITYEEKKPEVDVETIEESPNGERREKTNKKVFFGSMPKDFADLFRPVFDGWGDAGYTIFWGVTGFSVRTKWKGKYRSIIDLYPDNMSLITEKMVKNADFPLEAYHKYREAISAVPVGRQTLSEGRRYVNYKDISLDDFKIMLDATDKMIRAVKE